LSPVVIDFVTRHPEAAVDLCTGFTMIDLIQGGFDLAVSPHSAPGATLVRRRIGPLTRMVYGSPLYLQKHPAPQRPADLAGHNCLRHSSNIPAPDEWPFEDSAGNPVIARVTGNLITTSIETMLAAAAAGVGLVLTAHSWSRICWFRERWCLCCPNTGCRASRSIRSIPTVGT
jgi:DNA-binding transcriptional LysR family regulator